MPWAHRYVAQLAIATGWSRRVIEWELPYAEGINIIKIFAEYNGAKVKEKISFPGL